MEAVGRRTVLAGAVAVATAAASSLLAGCSLGEDTPGYPPGSLELVTGGTRGVYYSFGGQIARVAEQDLVGVDVTTVSTSGSVENLRRVAGSRQVLGFSALDAAAEAYAGTGPFRAPLDLRAVARVYDDYLHVVVRQGSGIEDLADLPGTSVSLGAEGSGTALIAERLLGAAGIATADLDAVSLGIDESLDAMRVSAIDAFFWSGGLPTGGVAELAQEIPLRLLPVVQPVQELHRQGYAVYRAATVPSGEYGLRSPVETLAVPNVLVVRADADAALVRALTRTLFQRRADIAATVPLAGALDRRSAIYTSPVPLHPGALAHYRATQR